jgi:hypothetical protein
MMKTIDEIYTYGLKAIASANFNSLLRDELTDILHQYKCSACGGYQLMREKRVK